LEGRPVLAPWQYMRQRAAVAAKESGGVSEYDPSRVAAELSEARRGAAAAATRAAGPGARESQGRVPGGAAASAAAGRSGAEVLAERQERERLRQLRSERASQALERAKAKASGDQRDAHDDGGGGGDHTSSHMLPLPSTGSGSIGQPVAQAQAHGASIADAYGDDVSFSSSRSHTESTTFPPPSTGRDRGRLSSSLKLGSAQQLKGLSKGRTWAAYMQSVHRSPSAPLVAAAPWRRQAPGSRQARTAG
jgi:hypothetical protein